MVVLRPRDTHRPSCETGGFPTLSEPLTVAEAGREGARRRWADHAPVRPYIGDLPNHQRKLIMAAIEAERERLDAAKSKMTASAVSETSVEAVVSEVRDGRAAPTS